MSLKNSLRIMVVDDMSTSRGLITQALDEIGIKHYDTANDGASALRQITASPVHLIISDYNMPAMDGLQLLEAVRTNRSTQKLGFILISGRADREIIERGQKLGLNNFIMKPFSPVVMKKSIEQVVGAL